MSGTTDTNWRSFTAADNGKTITRYSWVNPINGKGYDDIYKASNVTDLKAEGLEIADGREDSIDCVRGARYAWFDCLVHGSITIKGAIEGWRLEHCVIAGTIEVGQYDDYWKPGRAPTKGGWIINCRSPDGKPLRLKLWDADMPVVCDSNVQITRVPKWIWLPYFMYRYLTNPKANRS